MNKLIKGAAIAGALLVSSVASAATDFSDKFEGYDALSTTALSDNGWLYFVNRTDTATCGDNGGVDYGYGGGTPNDTVNPHISAITTTEAGPNQGVQGLSIFSDYNNNPAHDAGCTIETNVYQEQTIDAGDAGKTWVFRFDYKDSNVDPGSNAPSTAAAFIKTLDPGAGFATTNTVTLDVSDPPDVWTEIVEISLLIPADGSLTGQIIQFGGVNVVTTSAPLNYAPSAIYYDNTCWFNDVDGDAVCSTDSSVSGGLVSFDDNFEGYGAGPYSNELETAGYGYANNVFAVGGAYKFTYTGGAPSAGPQMSAITNGEGGVDQGTYQLNVYSDYDCCTAGTEGHNAGENVEVNILQEQTPGAADVGTTWQFAFDAKGGNILSAPNASSSAAAFIKVLDPGAGFSTIDSTSVDMTATPATWTGYSLSMTITAPMVGKLLQFGFTNTSTNFDNTGVFYDNLDWNPLVGCVGNGTDTDGDGVDDNCDNCILVANGPTIPDAGGNVQLDADGDGHGNICDGDFDNDCAVGLTDLTYFEGAFFLADALADLDGDGSVGLTDLSIFESSFFLAPGPSGADIVPAPSCNP